jgi:hypothetical protein
MTQDYRIGELSILLEELGAVTPEDAGAEVARLRHQVETGPLAGLAPATTRAMAVADNLCWDSLSRGNTAAFDSQALVAARLRQFAICGLLLADS